MSFKNILFVVLLFVAFSVQALNTLYSIEISPLSADERIALQALQGLVNRSGAQILIEPAAEGCFRPGTYDLQKNNVPVNGQPAISAETIRKFPNIENVWMDFYARKLNKTFQRVGFAELFQKFEIVYTGVVVYNSDNKLGDIAIATTISGLYDAIPVTTELRKKYVFFNKNIVEDLTKKTFSNKTDAQQWALDNYLKKSSRTAAYSYWAKENNFFSIDYAVQNRLFAFDLSFTSPKVHKNGEGKECPVDTAQSILLDRIFAHLKPASIIWGWAENYEYIIQARCGDGGHALICSNVSPNLSFHAAVKQEAAKLKQPRAFGTSNKTLENKVYITFSVNEGDTYKSVGNLMNEGSWMHDKRGKIPMNWPVNPYLLRLLPGLAAFYYHTATPLDYFYVSTSGIGYFDASYSTDKQRDVYAKRNKKEADFADLHYIDVWWNNFSWKDKWIDDMGVKGYTLWKGQQQVDYTKRNLVIESDMYYMKSDAAKMANYIAEQTKEIQNQPWFIHVYGCSPALAAGVMELLESNKYEAVCMDDFFDLARKGRPQVEGKTILKNKELFLK